MGVTAGASVRRLGGPVFEWELPSLDAPGHVAPGALRAVGPRGETLESAAFRDGERWRARIATYEPGEWRWTTSGGEGRLTVAPEPSTSGWPRGALRLSADRRFLVSADGAPCLYFADTAWSIVWKGTPDEWERYLDRRARQGFSVLQVNLLPWRWEMVDVAGNQPFRDGDPAHPNAAYFGRFDQFCTMAARRGLFVCFMLIWGGPRPLLPAVHFSQAQAVEFARYAVARFSAYPALWSLSGDAPYVQELDKWDAVGAAVEASDPYAHPTTNHLPPSMNWYALHHGARWHDFHMLQTGHTRRSIGDIADLPAAYDRLTPAKPCVNGEPWYEAHPSRDDRAVYGPAFTAADARYALWVSVLSGATMGHTYGSQGIWNWKHPGDSEEEMAGPQIGPLWTAALDHAGAEQCSLGVGLLRSLPWSGLRTCPERVRLDPAPTEPSQRPVCAATVDLTTWVVYLPLASGHLTVRGLTDRPWRATWFDPRTGERHPIPRVDVVERQWRAPPAPTADDWVLVVAAAEPDSTTPVPSSTGSA